MATVADLDPREPFEALVESVYVPLQRYLRRRTDAASADDVLGDVLLTMWRRAEDIPADSALAWCYGLARGALANSVRGTRRQHRLVRLLTRAAEPAQVMPPADSTSNLDSDLYAALAALSAADREVLRLWAWEQLAPREIAVALGITPNAASIRMHRATKRLREHLVGPGSAHHPHGRLGEPGGHRDQPDGAEAPR